MSDGGKGSSPRPFSVSQKTFGDNFDAIFRKAPKDVEDFKAEDEAFNDILERQRREQALVDLHRVSQELGLYDETDGPNRNTSNF